MGRLKTAIAIFAVLSLFSLQVQAAEPATLKPIADLPAETVKEVSPPPVTLKDPATYFNDATAPADTPTKRKSLAEEEAETVATETVKARAREEAETRSKEEVKTPVKETNEAAPKEVKKSLAEEEAEALAKAETEARSKEKAKNTPPEVSDRNTAKRTTVTPSKPAPKPVTAAEMPAAGLASGEQASTAPAQGSLSIAPPQDAATGIEAQRLARTMLANFKIECAPLASAKRESGMFGMFSSDDNPLIGKCLDDLGVYVNSFWASAETAEALNLMAALHRSRKDATNETLALARLVYLHNDAPLAAAASSRLLGLALEELKGERQALKVLAKGSTATEVADRYLQLIKDLAKLEAPSFLKLLRQQGDDYLLRFPGHAGAETVLFLREESFNREKRPELAAAGYRRIIAVYPDSAQRPGRLLTLGSIYDEQLKQYDQAVASYEQLYTAYPEQTEALTAYQRAARIYDEKLEKYTQSVALLDRIVSKYPKEEPAKRALEYEAAIYTLKIRNYYSAIKAYQRLADMFKGDAALQALVKAAELARTPVEDYELQIELQGRIVAEYPNAPEAGQALFDSAETYAEKLKNPKLAIVTYQQLIDKYPAGKLTEKAKANLGKLSSGK